MGGGRKKKLLAYLVLPGVVLLWILFCYVELNPKGATKISATSRQRQVPSIEDDKGEEKTVKRNWYRVVHLDLKGAPPRMSFLGQLLPLLAVQGCNALLVEYEDMFPYSGRLANLSAGNAYTKSQIRKLVRWAHDLDMEVIPLVQSFGHLEFALKLEEFKELREVESYPQEVCPSHPSSLPLVEEMINQVMELHPGTRYLHLGADEVFHLGLCPNCRERRLSPRELYTEHVIGVVEAVQQKYPLVRLLIWDDMMRQWPPQYLSSSRLTSLVEPVIWVYTEDVTRLLPHYVWHWYTKLFPRVWVAGAFKGATLPTSVLPDVEKHFHNQQSWLSRLEKATVDVAGFVLTGWSRYDHFAVLCELLPAAIPSLFLALNLLSPRNQGLDETEIFSAWRQSLNCPSTSNFDVYSLKYDQKQVGHCGFPGTDVYNALLEYIVIKLKVESLETTLTETSGWMTAYNVRHDFTNPWRLVEELNSLRLKQLQEEVVNFSNVTKSRLLRYVDQYTTDEWLEQRVEPLLAKLDSILITVEKLSRRRVWPRRPFR